MRSGDWTISYRDQQGRVSRRRISILGYETNRYGAAMVKAYCHLRHEERTFNLGRVLVWEPVVAPAAVNHFSGQQYPRETEIVRIWQAPTTGANVLLASSPRQPTLLPANTGTAAKQRNFPGKIITWFLVILSAVLFLNFINQPEREYRQQLAKVVAVVSPGPSVKPVASIKPKAITKPSPPVPKPVPKPSPRPVPEPTGDLATWTDAQLESEYRRLSAIIDREMDVWFKETDALGYDFRNAEVMRQRNASFARYQARSAGARQAWMAVIHEQTSRMMAEYRRERAREDENAQSNQQEVALRKQTTPEPQELTPRQKRNAAFTKANGCRSPQLLDLYARTDSNDDGQLSWDEIRIFQKRLYANYKYQINDPALSPDQFLAEGGGDCEDWALVTVGMLQYWDIKAYIGCFSPPENDKRIAHAIALVPVPEQVDGMFAYNITNSTEWYSGRSIPDGWYVPIDYATVGGITNAMGKDWTLTQVVDGTRMYGERW